MYDSFFIFPEMKVEDNEQSTCVLMVSSGHGILFSLSNKALRFGSGTGRRVSRRNLEGL